MDSSVPFTPIQNNNNNNNNNTKRRTLTQIELEGTPVVGDNRSDVARIQLCLELRKKASLVTKKKKQGYKKELVLEVVVMKIKNLSYLLSGGGGGGGGGATQKTTKKTATTTTITTTEKSTFVKIRMIPGGNVIHSTELKTVKEFGGSSSSDNSLDFIEVFSFPVDDVEDLRGKCIQVLVCDSVKMTRNSRIYGEAVVGCLEEISRLENSGCTRWVDLVAAKVDY